ncbi:MAG: amino acid permease, partial [Gemmatimonadetes bacterium]|nr:amino acid permease [Gemmatimonadota bacterium]
NLVGVKVAAGVERVLVVIKLVAFAVFAFVGMASINLANFHPVLGHGFGGVFTSLPLLVSLYMGIEGATEVGEEIRNGPAVIAKGLAVAVGVTIVVYLLVSSVALGVLGASALGASDAPLFDAGARFLGAWNTPVMLLAAVAAISTSINAVYLTFTRFLFAMGRDGVLPAAFARVHPQWGTPHIAVLAVFVLGVAGLLLPSGLVFLFLAISIPTMLKYVSNCWSAWRLVDHHPALHARAQFALSARAVRRWSGAGIISGIAIIVAGIEADWRPYAVLGTWFVLGCLYWLVRGQRMSRSMQALTASQRP